MPFIDTPNVVMVEIVGLKDGQIIENRIHVDVFHEPTSSDLDGLADVVIGWCNTSYAPLLPDEVTITNVKLTSLDARNRIQAFNPVTIPGDVAGGSLPNEVTYCASLKSTVIGRSARGRFYVLGVSITNKSGQNRVGAAYRAGVVSALEALRTAIAGIAYSWVIVSYFTNKALRPGGPVYFPVASISTSDDILDSQRRRKPGVGT